MNSTRLSPIPSDGAALLLCPSAIGLYILPYESFVLGISVAISNAARRDLDKHVGLVLLSLRLFYPNVSRAGQRVNV
jgi:hypothetical protein